MIYGYKGGNIGFSSSKTNDYKKKLFTPIQLSLPNVSDIDNHHENNLNSPRVNEKKNQTQRSKTAKNVIIHLNLYLVLFLKFNLKYL